MISNASHYELKNCTAYNSHCGKKGCAQNRTYPDCNFERRLITFINKTALLNPDTHQVFFLLQLFPAQQSFGMLIMPAERGR